MPLRKRIGIIGVGFWSALRGSNPPLCAMLRNVLPMHHRHNKPRLRLIRCYSWRVYSTLSTFASLCLYNTTLFSPKTCKVCKEKSGQQWPPALKMFFRIFLCTPAEYKQPYSDRILLPTA